MGMLGDPLAWAQLFIAPPAHPVTSFFDMNVFRSAARRPRADLPPR